ncbi:glycosyltransferase family 4 protein [Palaeococcus ferrophilus]|uniref:glycosyltransferase family 4 protein n=1 Tax=Palaeococcus ferrophilus TaxID=83868 RepID=UPI00064FFA54|nr:glycosyltransferase family 4 protein [Palaeococcus ferrophilus]
MGETLKIAFVYDVIYPWVKGGVEKRIYELATRLAKKHEVHIYGYRHWGESSTLEGEGITYHGTLGVKKLYSSGRRAILPPLLHSIKLVPLLSKERYDVIDCQAAPYFTCYASKTSRSPLVITWHEFWGDYWSNYLGKVGLVGKLLERGLFNLTDNHVAASLKTKKDLHNAGLRKDITVIPNGVDFRRIQEIEPSSYQSDIIFVGRLIKEKNVSLLLKALALIKEEIPDVKAVVIGDGPERQHLESLSSRLGLKKNVEFRGFLKRHEDVIAFMKASKVFAFPSLREGFGIVVVEANASGLPVVTVDYNMNASKDLINDGKNGFIARVDERDFAEKILIAFEKRRRMKSVSMNIASRYDWDEITERLEKSYLSFLP